MRRRRRRGPRHSLKQPAHLRAHFRRRACERLGWAPTRDEIDAIVRQIQRGQLALFDRQSNIVTRWRTTIRGRDVVVVYDSKRKTLRTVLPIEFFSQTTGDQMNSSSEQEHATGTLIVLCREAITRKHGTQTGVSGEIPCPIDCGGMLRYAVQDGCITAACSTEGCVAWEER